MRNIWRRTLIVAATAAGLAGVGIGCSTQSGAKDESSTTKEAKASAAQAEGEGVDDCSTLNDAKDGASKSARKNPKSPFKATGPIASVDGEEVSAAFFNEEVASKMGRRRIPPAAAKRFKKRLVRQAVDKWMLESAIDESDVTVTEKEVDAEFDTFKEKFPNEQAFQRFLKQRDRTSASLRVNVCRDLKLRTHLENEYDVEVSDEDVKSHYEANKKNFSEPEKVKASHILIKVKKDAPEKKVKKAKKKAKELTKKAQKPDAEFAKLAKKHSDGPSGKKGGDLGYFSRNRMVPDFSDAAFGAEPGKVVGPIRTRFGFHVIKVHDKKPAKTKELEDVRGSIEQKLSQRRMRQSMDEYLQALQDKHEIEYNFDNVEVKATGGGSRRGINKKLRKKLKKKLKERQKERKDDPSGEAPAEDNASTDEKPSKEKPSSESETKEDDSSDDAADTKE